MRLSPFVAIVFVATLAALAPSQEVGSGGKTEPTPAEWAAIGAATLRTVRAQEHLAAGRLAEAEAAFREAIRLSKTLFDDDVASDDRVGLAETLVALGREAEALEQYRLGARWKMSGEVAPGPPPPPSEHDSFSLGPLSTELDYARLLAKNGREEDAVAVLHAVLMDWTETDPSTFEREPLPVGVVFAEPDPDGPDGPAPSSPEDPGMTVWTYSPAAFRAAALAARRVDGTELSPALWDEVAALAPGWIVPRFYRIYDDRTLSRGESDARYDALLAGTMTDGERAAITAVRIQGRGRNRLPPPGFVSPSERRGSSVLLRRTRVRFEDPAFRARITRG